MDRLSKLLIGLFMTILDSVSFTGNDDAQLFASFYTPLSLLTVTDTIDEVRKKRKLIHVPKGSIDYGNIAVTFRNAYTIIHSGDFSNIILTQTVNIARRPSRMSKKKFCSSQLNGLLVSMTFGNMNSIERIPGSTGHIILFMPIAKSILYMNNGCAFPVADFSRNSHIGILSGIMSNL